MPRVSAKEKERSHARIVTSAAGLMRQHGVEATSVSDVMKDAGLTHGGFYRHFASKADLAVAAIDFAVTQAISELEQARSLAEQAEALAAYVDKYLSEEHVTQTDIGCPIAALATEVTRGDGPEQAKLQDSIERVIRALAKACAQGEAEDLPNARALFALLLGTITLARLSPQSDANPFLTAAKTATAGFCKPAIKRDLT